MDTLIDRLKGLVSRISGDEFYENRGLANEVPFYIFDYNAKSELIVRDFIKKSILPKFQDGNHRMEAIEVDLFELLIESMKADRIFDRSFTMEKKKGTEFLYEKLKKSFTSEIITKYIAEKSEGKDLVLIIGVGKIYPIVRTHTVLHNLQTVFDHKKVILFFPGEYTQIDLSLFGEFKDNNYYRAFKI